MRDGDGRLVVLRFSGRPADSKDAASRPRQLNRVFAPRGQSFLAGLQGRRERKAPVSRIAHTWRQPASEANPEAKNKTFFPERKQPPDPAGRIGLTERNGPGYGFLARELPGEALQLFGREREFERFAVQQLMAAVPHG